MQQFQFEADNPQETDRLGQALATHLPATATIALEGTLGAGKTRLVQAVAASCGLDPHSVTSPTFVLCQPYRGTRLIYHLDAYRVVDLDEFMELGVEEFFEGPGLTFIEWADRVAACLPAERLRIEIEITGTTDRLFRLTAEGELLHQSLARIARELS